MNAFFYPSNRGINFAKIRGFKVTDYNWWQRRIREACGGAGRNASLTAFRVGGRGSVG